MVHTVQVDGAALRALIERVERATGPDREIEEDVDAAFDQPDPMWDTCYTSSLDAVVALVERYDPEQSFPWSVHRLIGAKFYVAEIEGDEDVGGGEGDGKTPALALLLAFLRMKHEAVKDSSSDVGTKHEEG